MEIKWKVIFFKEIVFKISQDIVWGFHGENAANRITRLSSY